MESSGSSSLIFQAFYQLYQRAHDVFNQMLTDQANQQKESGFVARLMDLVDSIGIALAISVSSHSRTFTQPSMAQLLNLVGAMNIMTQTRNRGSATRPLIILFQHWRTLFTRLGIPVQQNFFRPPPLTIDTSYRTFGEEFPGEFAPYFRRQPNLGLDPNETRLPESDGKSDGDDSDYLFDFTNIDKFFEDDSNDESQRKDGHLRRILDAIPKAGKPKCNETKLPEVSDDQQLSLLWNQFFRDNVPETRNLLEFILNINKNLLKQTFDFKFPPPERGWTVTKSFMFSFRPDSQEMIVRKKLMDLVVPTMISANLLDLASSELSVELARLSRLATLRTLNPYTLSTFEIEKMANRPTVTGSQSLPVPLVQGLALTRIDKVIKACQKIMELLNQNKDVMFERTLLSPLPPQPTSVDTSPQLVLELEPFSWFQRVLNCVSSFFPTTSSNLEELAGLSITTAN